ncbi:phosphate ABC transporter substrate-binding protein PstS [Chamaesiphon sp. OTE_8_metabat_110]|uniref:phosphate ABC transporter substrate-binding protein PstS n=1 Tax=Chamaesiphon sp. OTE_8_metabat_110 TaxID=2964696 RepID=UPI00286BF900|nr:phosphate ABC transporter substrate-binding protein PstS [Chamaesiphon sp. OTE_8_metabat_110]
MNNHQIERSNTGTATLGRSRHTIQILVALTLGVTTAACTPQSPDVATPPTGGTASPAAGSGAAPASGGGSSSLSGAGASFPAPLYQRWFADYNKANPSTQISYQSVGSGAGIEQFLAGTVDFGATDAPLKPEERAKFKAKYNADPIQVPMTGGSVVFAYNLEGVKDLKLSRAAYCGIAAGKIKKWNDPAIAKSNPGAKLPDQAIQFVHRSDGSGTTYQFTTHLKAACGATWTAGANKSISWPTGTGAKGNEGVAAQIQQTPSSIGYVEYSYGKQTNLTMAAIENKSGQIVAPSPESGAEAFVGEKVPADLALTVADSANPKAYPISGLTWLLLYPQKDAAKQTALKSVIDWSLTTGKATATELGYVPLEASLVAKVKEELNKVK